MKMKEAKVQIEKALKITDEIIDYHKEKMNADSPKLVAAVIHAQLELIKMLSQAEVYIANKGEGDQSEPGGRPLQ